MAPLHSLIVRLGMKALGGQSYGGYTPQAAEVRTDARKMRVFGTCTTEDIDRVREVVVSRGVDWSEYQLNPIVTVLHGWRDPAKVVGRAEIDGQFTVHRTEKGWDFGTQFFQTGPNAGRAAEAFGLVDEGVLRGVSLGFRFLTPHAQKTTGVDGLPVLQINQCKPYEITFVPVPQNHAAIVRVVEKGIDGKRLSQAWTDWLKPMVPKRTLHGFTPQRREKAMPAPIPQAGGDPSMQQGMDPAAGQVPQAPAMPQQKPSIALMLAAEQYTMGFIKFLNDHLKVQENEQMKQLVPALILHLSQMYRALAQTHQQIQMEDQAFPNLIGHEGLLAPDAMPGFGDGLDGATGPQINAAMVPGGDAAGDGPNSPAGLAGPLPTTPGGSPDGGDVSPDPVGDGTTTPDQAGGDDMLADQDLDGLGAEPADDDDDTGAAPAGGGGDDLFGGMGDDDQPADTDDDADAEPDADEDDDAPPPVKKRSKGLGTADPFLVLLREKGHQVALERAKKLLDAHEAGMRRLMAESDLNILRWGAANLPHATADQLARVSTWMREKALDGVTKPAAPAPVQVSRDPAAFQAELEAEIARLLNQKAVQPA